MRPTLKFAQLLFVFSILFASCTAPIIEDVELYEATEEEEYGYQTLEVNPEDVLNEAELSLFNIVNEYRTSKGLSALGYENAGFDLAENHNIYMIAKNKLSHDNFNDRANTLAQRANAVMVAENVARHYHTVERALEGWLNSNAHKRTIEGDFTHTSLKISVTEEGKLYFTQLFLKK